MRRRDLLMAGYTDDGIRRSLSAGQIFRVRHGWYAVPGLGEQVIQVIRVGGRLTGLAALKALGLFLPPTAVIDIAVPRGAANLRRPVDRRARLDRRDGVRVNWIDPPQGERVPSNWMVSEDEALLCVLRRESREVAVSCCDALLRYRGWTAERLAGVFVAAPARVQGWKRLVDGRADAWGETVVRLRLGDARVPFEPQVFVVGVGWLDGRVSPGVFIEVDGQQHEDAWTGETPSSFESDHDRDIVIAIEGGRTIRMTYRQLQSSWPQCLAAIRRARADDLSRR